MTLLLLLLLRIPVLVFIFLQYVRVAGNCRASHDARLL